MKHDLNASLLSGYNVHTEEDRREMLEAIGVSSIEGLFSQLPRSIRLDRELDIPPPLSEWELEKLLRGISGKNSSALTHTCLLGGGTYEHHIPAVVDAIASRGEFLTAYTPYQPEMSQGILQVLYEFQTIMSRLLGLPAVHCSVYDGAVAMAESAWMACSIKGINRVAVAGTVFPEWDQVLRTYMYGRNVEVVTVSYDKESGMTCGESLKSALSDKCAGFLVQTPNRFGVLEDISGIVRTCGENETLSAVSCYPVMLGCLKSPGEQGADIVSCEAQSLGIPMNAGGPHLGVMATREEYEKFLPGRIIGLCKNLKNEDAYALVKEEREQHVARDQATSNICSNQALLALRAVVYLACLGEKGFRSLSLLNAEKAHYLRDRLCSIPGVEAGKSGRFFNEFSLELPVEADTFLAALEKKKIFGGISLASYGNEYRNHILTAVTEVRSKRELDSVAEGFAESLHEQVG